MKRLILLLSLSIFLYGCKVNTETINPEIQENEEIVEEEDVEEEALVEEEDVEEEALVEEDEEEIISKDDLIESYKDREPSQWGENVEGVITEIDTDEKIIALTFDACGGPYGSYYDEDLISYLIEEDMPATLFINGRWIDENLELFKELSENPIFEIENHGYSHKPLSVNGKSAYGIQGTENIEEVIDEILLNNEKIQDITGKRPRYFRSGTAFYDEVAVEIARDLEVIPVNFNVVGDGGARFSSQQVKDALLSSQEGSIVILHMNQPGKGIEQGLKMAIPILREKGFTFVRLKDYNDKLK